MSLLASIVSSLFKRDQPQQAPRELPTGISVKDGMARQLSQIPTTHTRWHLDDIEAAIWQADQGLLRIAAQLCRSLRRDGMIAGVLSTRTDGLVQLPLTFAGDEPEIVDSLRQDFRAVFPSAELAALSADGRLLGVGVAELVQVDGLLPTLVRRDPEFLNYDWATDTWMYQTRSQGRVPVVPGDGRWILHMPGGALAPWHHGVWAGLARAYVAKDHAFFYRENYSNKLANPARVGKTKAGSSEVERLSFFQKLAAWSINSVFALPEGWEIDLIESNGIGYEVFQATIDTANEEIKVILTGQTVTTDGGKAFANSAIHATIRTDLIQADADALAHTLNSQAIPVYVNERFGADAIAKSPRCSWDVTPPKDRLAEANAMTQMAAAAKAMNEVLAPIGKRVDIEGIARKLEMPIVELEAGKAASDVAPLIALPGGKASAQ